MSVESDNLQVPSASPPQAGVAKPQRLVEDLRRRILKGDWHPGGKLPVQARLLREYGVSGATVQRAIEVLERDGFVRARRRAGTFVVDHPPHLSHYAVAFHAMPTMRDHWSQFHTALANEAAGFQSPSQRVSMFYGIGDRHGTDHQRLEREVVAHRVAGVMFMTPPLYMDDTPLMREPGVPRVAVMSGAGVDGVGSVSLGDLLPQVMELLVRRGRRRVALITRTPFYLNGVDIWSDAIRAAGLQIKPQWRHYVDGLGQAAVGGRSVAHLLLDRANTDRPDALIITDDNLVQHATAGVLASGARVGEEVDVLAHTNFPWPTAAAVPVIRFGYDVRRVLGACFELIDRLRAGRAAPGADDSLVVPGLCNQTVEAENIPVNVAV